jgi:hypothetical protein
MTVLLIEDEDEFILTEIGERRGWLKYSREQT